MKSTSGGDGSYALTVSFEVGSDPDLNTVNVTNRVNQALAQLPPEVQRQGVTTKKQSSSLLQVVAVYSPKGTRDGLFLSNFATITLLDTLRRVPGVGDATLFGALDYSMRVWLNLDRMSSLDITANDVVKAVQAQNVQAAVGLVGAAPLIDDVGFQLNITTQGRLTTDGRVRGHRGARQARRLAGAHQGHRPRRARRQDQRLDRPLQRQAGRRHPDLPAARRQRARDGQGRAQGAEGPQAALPRRRRLRRDVRHHGVRARRRSRA